MVFPGRGGFGLVCFSLMETSGFPLFDVPLAGSRPGGRLTSLRRQRSKQERRPRFTGLLLKRCLIKRLPCAARIGRPAQNSPAARAQTAAPEGPAQCSAARRLRRGFSESPRVSARACVIDEKSERLKAVNSRVGRVSPQGVTRHPPCHIGTPLFCVAASVARCAGSLQAFISGLQVWTRG